MPIAVVRRRPTWRPYLVLFLFGFAFAFGLVAGCPRAPAPLPEPAPSSPTPPTAIDGEHLIAAPPAATPAEPPERTLVQQAAAPPSLPFAQQVEALAVLAQHTADLAQQDEIGAAKASDQQARELFGALLQAFPDAGERALDLLATFAAGDHDALVPSRRAVLRLVLGTELAQRSRSALALGDHSRIDNLVQATLDVMPSTSITVEDCEYALIDKPYLRLVHEPAVLGLVRLANEEQFPRPTATRLLLTLWTNLKQSGERSSDELSRLALLMLADADPSQRTAACRQLLGDTRYRHLVLAWLREHGDRGIANEMASLAARDLPPAEALDVLRELGPVLQRAPNAYLTLGFRAPELLADAYRELLASNTQPTLRTDLLAGVAMTNDPVGVQIAQLALDNDPSPDVRIQAVFGLSAHRDVAATEQAIDKVLDDPNVQNDPARLSAVVLAFQNLEASGEVNTIDRIGQRLSSMALPEESRQLLAGMLQRALPGGQLSRPRAR